MKVTEVKSFSSYDYKEKKYRGFELIMDDGKAVKRSILESEPMIMVGDEFPETDYEIVEAKDKNENVYFKLMKKQKENGWSGKGYQKEKVSPRSYMINTLLPCVFPDVIRGVFPKEQVANTMEWFIDWSLRTEPTPYEPNHPINLFVTTDQIATLQGLAKLAELQPDDLHTFFGVNSTRDVTSDECVSFLKQSYHVSGRKTEIKKISDYTPEESEKIKSWLRLLAGKNEA